MVVTRKRGSGRLGKVSGTSGISPSALPTQFKAKGRSVLSQGSKRVEVGRSVPSQDSERVEVGVGIDNPNPSDSADALEASRAAAVQGESNSLAAPTDKTTLAVAAQISESNLEMRNDCVMEERAENPFIECQQDLNFLSGNKRKTLAKNKGRGSESLGIRSSKGPKNTKSQKRSSFCAEGKNGLLVSAKVLEKESLPENGEDVDRFIPFAEVRLGYLVQEPCGSYSGGDNLLNKSEADHDSGGFRRRAEAGVEGYLPNDTRQHQIGESSFGAQGLVHHT